MTPRLDTLEALYDVEAHFVLAHPDKSPIRGVSWSNARPEPKAALSHWMGGGLVGLVPASLSTSCLDVDRFEDLTLALFAERYPPMATLRSNSGWHLYYKDGTERGNSKWTCSGMSGDVRSGAGYCIVWQPTGWETLYEGLRREDGVLFPSAALSPWTRKLPDDETGPDDGKRGGSKTTGQRMALARIQRQRGLWSGMARRQRLAGRDSSMAADWSGGMSISALARKYEVSRPTVRRTLARDQFLPMDANL